MNGMSISEKLLLVIFGLSGGTTKALQYEDIVVEAFKQYPGDFSMKGYPQYPESSNIHKRLYNMKKTGWIRIADKNFALTGHGVDAAKSLVPPASRQPLSNHANLAREKQRELDRIKDSAAFALFQAGKVGELIDADFYQYMGVTVRTKPEVFLGRIKVMDETIAAALQACHPLAQPVALLHSHLQERFSSLIEWARRKE